jgi:hypothetical protein
LNPTLASTINVFAGVNNIEFHWTSLNQEPPAPGVKRKVSDIIIVRAHIFLLLFNSNNFLFNLFLQHPMYNSTTGEYDIALLRLERSVELNSFIGLACLPKEFSTKFPKPDQLAWITGWVRLFET